MVKTDLMSRISKRSKNVRNRFDVSCGRRFTSPVGALIPFYYRELSPGDNIQLSLSNLTRTLPMRKANFGRIVENVDVFFVPFRFLMQDIQEMLSGTPRRFNARQDLPLSVSSTTVRKLDDFIAYAKTNTLIDDAGCDLYLSTSRLLHMLGYGKRGIPGSDTVYGTYIQSADDVFSERSTTNSNDNVLTGTDAEQLHVSVLPICAYQKIYQDYYRNKFWESENVRSYLTMNPASSSGADTFDFDSWSSNGGLQLQYCNFDRDRNFGFMPDEQGIFSTGINLINVVSKTYDRDKLGSNTVPNVNKDVSLDNLQNSLDGDTNFMTTYSSLLAQFDSTSSPDSQPALHAILQQLSALNMRKLDALQRFAEICALNKDDYKHQMSALFGVDIPDLNSDYCSYIGGMSQPVVLSDVEQTAPSSDSQVGDLASRGTVFSNGANINFTAREHGYLMAIYYLKPQVDYVGNMLQPEVQRFDRYDFVNPVLDDLGFEPVRIGDICDVTDASIAALSTTGAGKYTFNPFVTVGYLPRYFRYKTDVDIVRAGFAERDLNGFGNYCIKFDFASYLKRFSKSPETSVSNIIDYRYFKVYPSIVDNLFYVNNDGSFGTDEFISSFNVHAVVTLPLSVDGLPY